jgi:hypothetical protein
VARYPTHLARVIFTLRSFELSSRSIAGIAHWAATRYGDRPFALGTIPIFILVMVAVAGWGVLDRLAQLERRIKGARVELSELRSEGVRVRNDGIEKGGLDDSSRRAWKEATLLWNERTIECIGRIDQGCAVWFSVLDVVPPPRVNTTSPDDGHQKVFKEHDLRVARLGELIQQLWER